MRLDATELVACFVDKLLYFLVIKRLRATICKCHIDDIVIFRGMLAFISFKISMKRVHDSMRQGRDSLRYVSTKQTLHEQKVTHRNIKATNVFVDKVCDGEWNAHTVV